MTPGLELALGAMLGLGLVDIVYKRGMAAGVQAHHFPMLQGWFFLPAVLLYGLATGTFHPAPYMLWGMAAGLFVFIALYNFASALKAGSVSVVAPIFRLSFTVTTVLAVVLLGESLTASKLAGFAAALAAIWLLLGADAGSTPVPGSTRPALTHALVAMAAMGVANFLYKVGAAGGGDPATFIAGQAMLFTPLATAFAWKVDGGIRAPRPGWQYPAMTAALFLAALIMLFESLKLGQASVLVPISQMGFVVTAAAGVVFFKERVTARKATGLACALAALAFLAASPPASAQPKKADMFPGGKGIRVIIPYAPGGGNDAFGRFLVHGLNEGYAPGSVADNRGGAGTIIGTEIAARGNPDGHTLLIVSVPFVVLNALYSDLKIDALRDFTPVVLAGSSSSIMIVNAATPYRSVKDLIDAARAKPGAIAYASSGGGGSTHLIMELFKSITKTSLIHVPYKGGGPAVTALIGGEVAVHFTNPQTSGAFIRAGRVRALAVTAPARLKAFPDVPTMIEAGVPGCEGGPFWGVAAPAKTPKPVVAGLNAEFNRILGTAALQKHFANEDVQVAGGSPEEFGVFLRKEVALWGKVIREAKIKAE